MSRAWRRALFNSVVGPASGLQWHLNLQLRLKMLREGAAVTPRDPLGALATLNGDPRRAGNEN